MSAPQNRSRREFLISWGRKFALGGLAWIGVSLGWRTLFTRTTSCYLIQSPCQTCSKLSNCKEDRAINERSKSLEKNPSDLNYEDSSNVKTADLLQKEVPDEFKSRH